MDQTNTQRRLAAIIRQFFRAQDAKDYEAIALESSQLCSETAWLLADHLKDAPDWDDEARWIDGMIDSKVIKLPEFTVRIEGQVVWGLSDDPGGKQWREPLWAEVRATNFGIEEYEIRFGHPNEQDRSEVEFGLYSTCSTTDGHSEPSAPPALNFNFRGGPNAGTPKANNGRRNE